MEHFYKIIIPIPFVVKRLQFCPETFTMAEDPKAIALGDNV